MPDEYLRAAIRERTGLPSAAHLLQLALRFDVSAEVLVRRVHDTFPRLFDASELAPVLVRGPRELVEFGVRPTWLQPVLPRLTRGVAFDTWFRPGNSDGFSKINIPGYAEGDEHLDAKATLALTITRPGYGIIRALRFEAGPSLGLYEISAELSPI